MKTIKRVVLRSLAACFLFAALKPAGWATEAPALPRKVRDVVIYRDARFHAAFPSVVRRPDGELLLAFRRAPDRQMLGEAKTSHVDPNSQIVAVRSRDGGVTWSDEPQLVYAHAFGGAQDPCLLQLRDGTLLCPSYGWAFLKPEAVGTRQKPVFEIVPGVLFLGGFVVRSEDGGRTWSGPAYPPHLPAEINRDPYGNPLPAYNRGALCEGRDGRIFWAAAATEQATPHRTAVHLLVSADRGRTWSHTARVATDPKVTFNEASVHETPRGDLVVFLRTANLDDHACLARSTDGGRTFAPWQDLGFKGHPLQATALPDGRVLLVYGYRHQPYGIRARVLNAECTDAATAPEIVLRDDGGITDLGYPWSVVIDAKHVLVAYYFNVGNGPRHIAGTLLELP